MPIVQVHLLAGEHGPSQVAELLRALTTRYAEVLDAPVERIRAFVTEHPPQHWATGGEIGVEAPYFTALVLADRPVEQRRRLIGAFTDVIAGVLGVERRLIRGRIEPVDPGDWGIAGIPASTARRSEIDARR
jgi:4-oxalocrotonate tautomerase family enzyme